MVLAKPEPCRPCALYGNGQGFSYLEGTGASGLFAVGEALGSNEHKDALPFRPYAKAGSVFQRVLDDLHIDRDALTITNVVRCQPIHNELLGASYERAAIDYCAPYLRKAVTDRQPRCILALGAIPIRELAPTYSHLNATAIRGFALPSRYGVPVVGTVHPSYIARGAWHLYGVLLHDIQRAYQIAQNGLPKPLETTYELLPTVARVEQYYRYLLHHPEFDLAYDVETAGILGEKEPTDWKLKRIVQIQFAHRVGFAIVLPYEGDYRLLAHRIMSLPNRKLGYNSRTSDDVVLRADGCVLGGELHDLMLAYAHYQPDFAGGKDEHEEKGIPTRLMGLQSCASFFVPEALPWKHTVAEQLAHIPLEQRWSNYQQRGEVYQTIAQYGAIDADYHQRCGVGLFEQLHKRGLWHGYMEYKQRLRFVLDDIGTRGLPVDRERQKDLAQYVAEESTRINTEIQALVPYELRGVHPACGYFKTLSPKVKRLVADYDATNPPLVTYSNFSGHLVRETVTNDAWDEEERWLVRKLFNPNSPQQLLAYIKYMNYPVPRHIDTKAETTNAFGIETLVAQTDDALLKLVQQQKKLITIGSRYSQGDWVPGDDGRVHATFGMLTGSGQTTAKAPNCQQLLAHHDPKVEWQVRLAKLAKHMVRAEPGYVFVKTDLRAFHARMQGFLAEDAAYYRLASLDCHSFVTAHYVGVGDKDTLLQMSDADLLQRLKEIKRTYEHERNYLVKRVSFLNQYLGGAAKAATILRLPISEVQYILDTISDLFPKAFKDFPAKVQKLLGACHITTPFGCHRFIWDRKIQEGVASIVANSAHCHVQSALIRLYNQGVFERYGACNFAHDSLWMHVREGDVDDAVRVVRSEFERPSTVLRNSLGAFFCYTDSEYGPSMSEMQPL